MARDTSSMTDLLPFSDVEDVLPEHLVGLADDEWALWRDVCLRGAGFPVSQILELAAPACALLADRVVICRGRCEQARDEALQAIGRALLPTSHFEAWQCRRMTDAVRLIRKMRLPAPCEVAEEIDQLVERYRQIWQELAQLQDEFTRMFAHEMLRLEQTFYQFAGDERVREAIAWQNRQALQQGIDVLLRHPPGTPYSGAARRRYQTLLANYLQRYCAKNDSIGFFGPFGWASLVSSGPTLVAQPGPGLVASRTVYFEGWCIDTLAEVFSQRSEARPWMVPSLLPHLRLAGHSLVLPFAPPVALTRPQFAVLSLCKGRWTAERIARELLAQPQSDFRNAAEVYALLEQLNEARRIKWAFEISPEGAHPERGLRRVLEQIGDETLRQSYLAQLTQLEQAREQVIRATGDADALSQALTALEETFVQLTGVDSTRSAGKTYAARTLVYEDCRRDARVTLGPDFVQALEQPLRLLLLSARWFTYQTALFFQRAFLDAYRELLEPGKQEVDFAAFWLWLHPLLLEEKNPLADALLPTFQQIWEQVLPFDETAHRVQYSSQAVLPDLAQAFDAPGPGWKAACYHAPDLLIEARDPQAIQQGNYQIVLGEFHMAMNTLQISACLGQHPEPERLLHCIEADLPEPRVLPIFSRQAFPLPRIRPALISSKDVRLIYAADVCADPEDRAFSIGELVVTEMDGKLFVADRDNTFQCEIIEVFAEFLTRSIYTLFKPFATRQHMPRITIDRLVLMRETWCFAPASIAFVHEKDAEKRFLAGRQWVQEHQLPRFTFVKVPGEQKPCFVDFTSPLSLDIFARLVRQNASSDAEKLSIVLSEMLPGPEASWLQNAAGEQYTSELRFIAVDLLLPPA